MTWVLSFSNSGTLSENWQISVGHTKVKSRGQKKRTVYLPAQKLAKRRQRGSLWGVLALTLEVIEGDLLELVVPPGLAGEGRGGSADNGFSGLHVSILIE